MILRPFQEKTVSEMTRILRERNGVYCAHEMGLGKTPMAIETCNKMGFENILVVCPAVMVNTWKDELEIWRKSGNYTITTYGQIHKVPNIRFNCLILDEAHYVKNPKAKRSKEVFRLWGQTDYRICLSGTPFTQSVIDCHTLFSRLAPEHFKDYWGFAYKYTRVRETPWGKRFEGIRNADDLKTKIRSTFFLRQTKEEVLTELPPKVWTEVKLDKKYNVVLSPEQMLEQERYQQYLKDCYAKNMPIKAVPPKSIGKWRHEQGVKKIPGIVEFCKNILDQNLPLVLFLWHTEVIEQIAELLKDYNPAVIQGSVDKDSRHERISDFQSGKTDLFIGQIAASGVGITLTRSSTVVFGELDFSPANVSQAADRCHRIGQRDVVNIYWLVVEGSVDEKIAKIVVSKSKTFNEVLRHD